MHLFHCPDLAPAQLDLPAEEAHHALHVLRLAPGARIGLLDGRGGRAEAELIAAGKRHCTVRVLERRFVPAERAARIHLAVAPTKQIDRFEWCLEKATELGVDRMTPLLTQRSERDRLRQDRLEKVLVGAMKQSQRAWLPRLDGLTKLTELKADAPQRFFGWCEGAHEPLAAAYDPAQDAVLLIGPEGDFTPAEAAALIAQGYRAVSLGSARLRTETAAIAACAWMNLAQQ